MRFTYYFCFIFLLIGCENTDKIQTSLAIIALDSIQLDEKKHPLQTSIISPDFFNNYNCSVGLLMFTNPTKLLNYNEKGEIDFLFDRSSNKSYLFPDATIGNFYRYNKFVYILYPAANIITKVDLNGNFVQKYNLEMPVNMEFSRVPKFFYDEKTNNFIIGISLSSYKNKNEYYEKSPILGIFNNEGKLTKTVGKYPKEYQNKGNYFSSSFATSHVVKDDSHFYLLFPNIPFIEKYKLNGDFVEKIDITSKEMDYTIHFDEQELENIPEGKIQQNEYYNSLAIDKSNNNLYILSARKKKKVLGCYNQKSKTYQEIKMPLKQLMLFLLPEVKKDTLYIYHTNLNADEKYIIKFLRK